jgi:hypothetical protein
MFWMYALAFHIHEQSNERIKNNQVIYNVSFAHKTSLPFWITLHFLHRTTNDSLNTTC